ncbi:hypothetical protein GCM10019016_074360 [Streptomyces prasinosporus]|uniref:Uncharacterized protein n=1 Tax=Streptomyces prasinosporus TaxID=68256 RepID=A0ABP6U000_9ACTN
MRRTGHARGSRGAAAASRTRPAPAAARSPAPGAGTRRGRRGGRWGAGRPTGPAAVGTAAAVPLVALVALVRLAFRPVLPLGAVRAVLADARELRFLVAGLRAGRRRGRGLARGVVDGDRDPDRTTALAAQGLADDGGEAAFEHALGELVRNGEQRGVGDQRERLTAPDPVLVLALDPLPAAFAEELIQYAWPHCGKIGRYVSHRARSLTVPSNV